MSETYEAGRFDETTVGRVIIMVGSAVATVLVIAAVIYAAGTGPRHQAALAAAGCEPNLSPVGLQCTTVQMLTSKYVAVVTPANQQLGADEAAYSANENRDLAAARVALTAEAASDSALGRGLAGIDFPPAVAPLARTLVRDNQARAALVATQARSSSLSQLRSYDHRVQAANATVEAQMQLVLKALQKPPATPGPAQSGQH
jgi:hypothetical protein